jgi:hypothetical protein
MVENDNADNDKQKNVLQSHACWILNDAIQQRKGTLVRSSTNETTSLTSVRTLSYSPTYSTSTEDLEEVSDVRLTELYL